MRLRSKDKEVQRSEENCVGHPMIGKCCIFGMEGAHWFEVTSSWIWLCKRGYMTGNFAIILAPCNAFPFGFEANSLHC
jgi:hypothetical protein